MEADYFKTAGIARNGPSSESAIRNKVDICIIDECRIKDNDCRLGAKLPAYG